MRISLGLFLLAGSILFLVWGYRPAHRELRVRPVSASGSASAEEALTLLFPPKIRAGETGVFRLTVEVDALKDLLLAADGGNESPNIHDAHHLIAEARFDLPGISVRPSELISAPVSQGQTAVFYWTLRPIDTGKYRGTIWLYLRLVDKLTAEERRETVSAQLVEIESVKLLGLSINQVRMTGMTAFVIGFILSLPLFEARIAGFL
jgi:hypothetical protein